MADYPDSLALLADDDDHQVLAFSSNANGLLIRTGGVGEEGHRKGRSVWLNEASALRLSHWLNRWEGALLEGREARPKVAEVALATAQPKPTAQPWKLCPDGSGCWMRSEGASSKAVAIVSLGGEWDIYSKGGPWYGGRGRGQAPTIAHGMAAADKALAEHMTVSAPAPTPPDLSGVEFGGWVAETWGWSRDTELEGTAILRSGDGFAYDGLHYPAITTREAADDFLRACGATLAQDEPKKRARWRGLHLYDSRINCIGSIDLGCADAVRGVYKGREVAKVDSPADARSAVEVAAFEDGWTVTA